MLKPKTKPKKEKTKVITVRLPESMIDALDALIPVLRREAIALSTPPERATHSRTEVIKTALTRLISQYQTPETGEIRQKHTWR